MWSRNCLPLWSTRVHPRYFREACLVRSFVICVVICRSLFVLFLFAIALSVLFRFTGFWLLIWYLQTLLLIIFNRLEKVDWRKWDDHKMVNIIYLLTGYEGIASLLFSRRWLLSEAKPRSIVSVSRTTNLLFPNTQSISILLYWKTLDS
jgi:hypothetical protein